MNAIAKLNARIDAINSLVCVGLDPRPSAMPAAFAEGETPLFAFSRAIIDATHPYAVAFKPNTAYYEAYGAQGWHELALTMAYLREHYPQILTVCDAKRADIGTTNTAYARAIFDELGFDAVTLHPYLGKSALTPFLERTDKACIVLCRTSNEGAGELQDLHIDGAPLWEHVARHVSTAWNTNGNCMLVVGATYPQELARVRHVVGDMPLLVPGIGAQGGDIASVVTAGKDANGRGLLINASRSIIYAQDPAQAARQLRDEINAYR
jgi:orotidine-5'-phosphate decarboxylase